MPERFEYNPDKNPDVLDALSWAQWLVKTKDPGSVLLASKRHAATFLEAYKAMAADLNAENSEAFIAGYTHGVTMARFENVPSPEDAYKMAVQSELGLA